MEGKELLYSQGWNKNFVQNPRDLNYYICVLSSGFANCVGLIFIITVKFEEK